MTSFVLSFFPLGVLDEIWDLIESVSEGFLTYSYSRKCNSVMNSTLRSVVDIVYILTKCVKSKRIFA